MADLFLVDDATGRRAPLPVTDGVLAAADLASAFRELGRPAPVTYDPGFAATAAWRSAITLVDGDAGLLTHRGVPVPELVRASDFPSIAHLLLHGGPPDDTWHAHLREAARAAVATLTGSLATPTAGHPMHQVMAAVATLAAAGFEPDVRDMTEDALLRACASLVAQVPVAVALVHQRWAGYVGEQWRPDAGLMANLARTLVDREATELPSAEVEAVLDTLFVLHADHEQNCGTSVVRAIASAGAGPYTAVTSAIGALHGPRHGGAAEAVLWMLRDIGEPGNVSYYLDSVRRKERRLVGFGSRAYRTYDSRVALERALADRVFAQVPEPAEFAVARELERQAVGDPFFASRKLFPNVDLYSGLLYQALGFAPPMLPALFAAARTAGWVAHWYEAFRDPETRLVRPRQVYVGTLPRTAREGR